MHLQVNQDELDNNNGGGGLEIHIEGVLSSPEDDPANPCPVFIENYKDEIRVIIWNGESDPQIIVLKKQPVS